MSVILKKETIQISKILSQKYSQTTVECDVIVPDVNPDIKKVLEVSGYITITEKSLRAGKVYVQGSVNMTVLYSPDGEAVSKVKSLSGTQAFNHSLDVGNPSDAAFIVAEIEPESFNYSLINSRKINLRCTTGINVKVIEPDSFETASSSDSGSDICTESRKIRICNTAVNSENRVVVCEQAELPSGNPSINEILKAAVYPESTELTLMENSALAKGQARICFLYTSLDDGSVQTAEYTIPFEETLDIAGAEEDMEAEIEYMLSDMYYEVRDDSDGEPRIFGFEIGLSASLRGIKIQEPEIICDAYSLDCDTKLISQPIVVEQLTNNTTARLTHKASVNLPDALPDIAKICDVSITASVDRISADNGEINVFGKVKSNILYMTNDPELPLCNFCDVSDFTHTLASASVDSDTICDAKIFTEHTSYTMNSSNSLDLRVILGLSIRCFKEEELSPVTDIEVDENSNYVKRPCIRIFFVQKGDTLWSIAKKYKTTVDALKECNNLTSDTLDVGQLIKIC